MDLASNLYIADNGDSTIREIRNGNINAVAGMEMVSGYGGIGGSATAATLNGPSGVAFDTLGNLFLTDSYNGLVDEVFGTPVQKVQTITFPVPSNVVYSANPVTLDATSTSGLTVTYQVISGPGAVSGNQLTTTGAGTIVVEADQSGNSLYLPATPVQISIPVTKAVITVTAQNDSIPFGQAINPAQFPYAITGLVGSDTTSGAPVLSTTATSTSPASTSYPITVMQGSLAVAPLSSAGNYTFNFVSGTLTITGNQEQSITFPNLPATVFAYGAAPLPLSATTSSGLPITYTSTGSGQVIGSAGTGYMLAFTGVGPGTVTATQPGNSQYTSAAPATQAFHVTPLTVSVSATNVSEPFGSTIDPTTLPYTITPSTLANGDMLTGAPALSTTETATSPIGSTYPVTIAAGTLAVKPAFSAANYSFTFTPGTVTVVRGTQTINFPSVAPVTYGPTAALPLTATATSGLPVGYTIVSGPGTLNGAIVNITGAGNIVVMASQAGNASIAAAQPVTQTIAVLPALLTVTANSFSRAIGGDNPVFTYAITGFVGNDTNNATVVSGTPVLTTTATDSSPVGTYPIVPTQGTLSSANYTFAFVDGTLTVNVAPSYILTANPSSLTIPAGQSRQTTIVLTPVNNYQGSVTLSCGSLPANVTCTFSPATLTLAAGSSGSVGPVQTSLTVNTNANAPVVSSIVPSTPMVFPAAVLFLPGGLLATIVTCRRRHLRMKGRAASVTIFVLILLGCIGMSACGGGGSSSSGLASPGTAAVTVTAAASGAAGSGSPNNTSSFNLTITVTQ